MSNSIEIRVPKPDQPKPKPDGQPKPPPRPAARVFCCLLINDTAYSVERLSADPDVGIVKAFRLTKARIDQQYDVVLTTEHGVECECGDFLYRHADQGPQDPGCKHIQALRQFGMLADVNPPAHPEAAYEGIGAMCGGLIDIDLSDETPF
jgi:hypothetical protein